MSVTQRRPRRARKTATIADYASLTFEGIKADASQGDRSEAAWLESARNEFFVFHCAVNILAKNDTEMAADVQNAGAEPFLALVDSATELVKKYKTGAKVLDSMLARVMCGLSRLPGMAEAEL